MYTLTERTDPISGTAALYPVLDVVFQLSQVHDSDDLPSSVPALVDTGSPFTIVPEKLLGAKRNTGRADLGAKKVYLFSPDPVNLEIVNLDITIGSFIFKDQEVLITKLNFPYLFLGNDLLCRGEFRMRKNVFAFSGVID